MKINKKNNDNHVPKIKISNHLLYYWITILFLSAQTHKINYTKIKKKMKLNIILRFFFFYFLYLTLKLWFMIYDFLFFNNWHWVRWPSLASPPPVAVSSLFPSSLAENQSFKLFASTILPDYIRHQSRFPWLFQESCLVFR